ncbi:MAG: hypothetical protein MjAS7_1647 [Metallosphaera javensis (ex Sakai et al. 2022)]|nr:MAG: hypothetical protein MjAS7_1647 [Metallosphaera javensis (ex Sakai et al. 2022)]
MMSLGGYLSQPYGWDLCGKVDQFLPFTPRTMKSRKPIKIN